jgi:putative hydrolase of the HAD superfamily
MTHALDPVRAPTRAGVRAVDAVLLDAGNTLVFVDQARTLGVLARHGAAVDHGVFRDVEREARIRLSSDMGVEPASDEGRVWSEYFRALFVGAGIPAELLDAARAALRAEHASAHLWTHVDPDTPAALERMRGLGYRLAVVSNADGRVEALLEERGLAGYFEFVLDSHVVGIEKPDRRIFDLAVRRMELEPGRCLYAGDLYAVDVLGARAAGLRAVLLDPFDHFDLDVDRIPSVAHLPAYLEGLAAGPG